MNDDIKEVLFAWGEWARSDTERMGFKNNWDAIFSLAPEPDLTNLPKSKKDRPFILDSQASRIDRIVSELSRSRPMIAIAIKARYVHLMSIEAIGKGELALHIYGKDSKTSVGKHKVRELLAKGEGFIEGALNNYVQ